MNRWTDFWLCVTESPLFGLGIVFAIFLPPLALLYSLLGGYQESVIPAGAEPVAANIVAFETPITKYPSNRRLFVVARTSSGMVARRAVSAGQVSGCHIGDSIPAFTKGPYVYLRPAPCP